MLERYKFEKLAFLFPMTHLRISISNLTASTATSYSRSMTMDTIRSCKKENIAQNFTVSIPKIIFS